jgi:hypothetical protein
MRIPRQLAPTVGLLAAPAGVKFWTRPFTSSGERIVHGLIRAPRAADSAGCDATPGAGVACPAGCLVVPFGALRIFVALIPDEYPGKVHSFTDSPVPVGCAISDGVAGLRVRVEVLTTGASSGSPRGKEKAAAAAAPPHRVDPLRETIRSLQAPITPDADMAAAVAQLNEDRQHLLDEATTLAATRRRLESA